MTSLSAVIITQNEEEMVEGCLRSVTWADEIIIVDGNSVDKTRDIAKKYTKKVFTHEFTGFASQKNYAISKATKDWILLLDADERVSAELQSQISRVLSEKPRVVAYDIKFINYFLGKRMDHGGWQHETHIRLFKRGKARYVNQEIHEYLKTNGDVAPIDGHIYHFSHRDISSNLLKTKQYAELEAKYHFLRHSPKVTRWSLLKGVVDHFWYRYIKEKGYKDGVEGFIEAMYQSFSYIFIIQSMLWEKQRDKSSKELYSELDKQLIIQDYHLI